MSHSTLSKHDDRLLSIREVAAIYGQDPKTIWRAFVVRQEGPPVVRLGPKSIRFRESDVREFIESKTIHANVPS